MHRPAVLVLLLLPACQPSGDAPGGDLRTLLEEQDACFAEAGLAPVSGPVGGQTLTGAQYATFDACMKRSIAGGPSPAS